MSFWKKASEFLNVAPTLTAAERMELEQCCKVVRHGLRSFMDAGRALDTIRTKQLYRVTHSSFEAFAEAEFGLSSRRLQQLVESFRIVETLKSVSPNLPTPTIEAAVRPLAGLPAADQVEAFAEAVEAAGGVSPTPKVVKAAADKRRPKSSKRLPKPVRFKVPGAIVTVTPNRAFESVEAALMAALTSVREMKQATREAA